MNWVPIVLAACGTLIAGITGLLVGVLAWIFRFSLDDARSRLRAVEERCTKVETGLVATDSKLVADKDAMIEVKEELGCAFRPT